MKYIKITDLFPDGQSTADYKGLDINQFVSGSQVYDFENGVCLVRTRESDITEHQDIQKLTEEEYEEIKDVINSNSPTEKEKNQVQELMLAVAELAEKQSQDKTENQIALAELAETLGGAE